MALRNNTFADALAAYRQLQRREPRNPIWCQRRAEIYQRLGENERAIRGFDRARAMAVEAGDIIFAIAACKHILALDPNHAATLDHIHLLHVTSPQQPSESPFGDALPAANDSDETPLEEVLLTDLVQGASPMASNELETSGIMEIPLTEVVEPTSESARQVPDVKQLLLDTPLFGSLDAKSLRALMKHARIVSLEEGETLFRQGDTEQTLYVVTDGAVVPIAEEDSRKKLAVLEAGSFFGEIGLMTNRPRNATIQAIVDTRLLAIDRKVMWALIRKNTAVLDVMLRFLRDRLVDRLLRTNPLFTAIPAKQRPSVAKLFRFLEVRTGSTLVEQGKPSENLFALLAGSAQAIKMDIDTDKVLGELEPGVIFGEMSMLNDTPAVAAVVATSKCWVLAISRKRFEQLRASSPKIEAAVKAIADARKSANASRASGGPASRPGGASA